MHYLKRHFYKICCDEVVRFDVSNYIYMNIHFFIWKYDVMLKYINIGE